MGCDIHLFCEYREDYDTWKCADHFRIRTDDVPAKVKIQSVNDYPKYLEPIPLYDNRSYAFFSLLADVRNSGDVKPMDDRRGLPHDVSDIVKAYSNYWGAMGTRIVGTQQENCSNKSTTWSIKTVAEL